MNDYPITDEELLGILREVGSIHDALDRLEVALVAVLRDRDLDWKEIAAGTNQSYQNLQKRLRPRRRLMGLPTRRSGRGPSAGRRGNGDHASDHTEGV